MTGSRIYVRLPNWVGDVVMAEPFLRALRRGFPEATIEVHARPHLLPFIRAAGHYDNEVLLQRGHGLAWPIREGRRLKRERLPYDLAVLLPNSLSSALIAWSMGAPRRVGYRLNARDLLLTRGLPVRKQGRLRPIPMVEYYLGLADALGVDTRSITPCPSLPAAPEATAAARALFERLGVDDDQELWGINAGGAWLTKHWTPAHAARLADRMVERGARPFILGGPEERELAAEIVRHMTRADPIGLPVDLVPLDGLIAILKRLKLLVSTDSGPRHFGVAAGIPVLGLIGPTHPGYTGYSYEHMDIVCDEAPCWPCHKKKCPNSGPEHHVCMRALDGDRVYEACLRLLDRVEAEPAA